MTGVEPATETSCILSTLLTMNNNQHNFDDTQNTDETQILNTSLEQYRYLNQLCAEERL